MIRGARIWAVLVALAVHILLAGAFVGLTGGGNAAFETPPPSLDVVLVAAPEPAPTPQSEPEPVEPEVPAPVPAPEAAPFLDPAPAPQAAPEQEPSSSQPLEALATPDRAPPSSSGPPDTPASAVQAFDVLSAPGGEGAPGVVFEAPSGQGGALRGVACAGAGQAMREALGCDGPAYDLTAYASEGAVDAIALQFALPQAGPSAEAWLRLGLQPPPGTVLGGPDFRLSGSDSMLGRLPTSDPDPAFGD
jgi:hypothetical protein